MTLPPDDPDLLDPGDLRVRFSRLREQECGRVPDFRRTWAAARGRMHPRRRRLAAAVSAAGLAGALVLAVLGGRWLIAPPWRASSPPPALADWRSPTGFLLATPADELLHTTPRLGDPHLGTERTTP